MAREYHLPDESERRAFLEQLGQFRQSLPPRQQQMLDIMAVTTFAPHAHGDVQGYEWFMTPGGWYNAGWANSWTGTPYENTAYGLYSRPDGKYLP